MFLISRYLKCLKNDVAAERSLLSDALISALKVIRPIVEDARATFFNRELLGYLDNEAAVHEECLKATLAKKQTAPNFLPSHRLIEGYWVTMTGSDWRQVPAAVEKRLESIFYPHGVCELEEVLGRVTVSDGTWISILFDEDANRVFMSRTSDLKKLQDRCRKIFCKNIELIAKEVRAPRIPSAATLLEMTYEEEIEKQTT